MLEQIKMQMNQKIAAQQEQSAQDGEEIAQNRAAVDEANQKLISQQAQYDKTCARLRKEKDGEINELKNTKAALYEKINEL